MLDALRHLTRPSADPIDAHLPATPLCAAEHVTVRFGDAVALDDVSFTLEAGQQVAVVGPNGAGKSTLFKLIAGEIRPSRGHLTLYGSAPEHHLCVAYVPQRKTIDFDFPVSVADVVMMGRVAQIGPLRWPRRRDWTIVRDSLARVGVDDLADKSIGDLSGGQQQRVFIARALAQQAELLLLDEPLTGLDIPSQERFFTLLDTVSRDGLTTVIATHDLNLAARRFDRVMLLNRRLIGFGPPSAVLTPANLTSAYGGHLHRRGDVIVVDDCCG